MSSKDQFYFGTLISFGAFFIGIVSTRQEILKHFYFPDWISILLLLLGLGLILIAFILPLKYWQAYLRKRNLTYLCRHATIDEIDWMIDYAKEILPEHTPTREKALYWFSKNPRTFFLVVKKTKSKNKLAESLVGVFVLTPINITAKNLMVNNILLGGMLDVNHISALKEEPAAYYIGSIVSSGLRNKYRTLLALSTFIQAKLNEKEGNIIMLTNPVTEDGLRLANQHGFIPVSSTGNLGQTIYSKEFKHL